METLTKRLRQVEGLREEISVLVSESELWAALTSQADANVKKLVVAELRRRGYSDPWKLV